MVYAQPLLDQTDGFEQMNKAMTISQLCWNLALRPEDERAQMLSEIRPSLKWMRMSSTSFGGPSSIP